MRRLIVLLFATCLTACGEGPDVDYVKRNWSAVPGWAQTDVAGMLPALRESCGVYAKRDAALPVHAEKELFGTYADWHAFCEKALSVEGGDLRAVFESTMQPYEIVGEGNGLFTGYYEPELRGAFEYSSTYSTPLHRKPGDLLVADLSHFSSDEALKGKQIVGRVKGDRFIPYHTRTDIHEGALPLADVLMWLDSPIDAFFLQIQGSGRVRLPDGKVIYVGYDGKNGHRYTPIGRWMVEQGFLTRDNVSLQTIRAWLDANPDRLHEALAKNASYVFFRLRDDGPYGAQGVVLTPERSMAVDTRFVPLGVPLFVNTQLTGENNKPFTAAMVAQDVGGAITGAIRGDIYFGHGERAEHLAGHQQAAGRLFVFIPRTRHNT